MELPKDIYEALTAIKSQEQFENFMRVATIKLPKAKAGSSSKLNLYKYVAGKDKKPLSGVYHDKENECAVATDAYIMVVSKSDYNEKAADMILARDGKQIGDNGVRYPDYKWIIEQEMYNTADMIVISEHYKEELAMFNAKSKAAGFKPLDPRIRVKLNNDELVFNYKFLCKFLEVAKHFKFDKVDYSHKYGLMASGNGNYVKIMSLNTNHTYWENTDNYTTEFLLNNF